MNKPEPYPRTTLGPETWREDLEFTLWLDRQRSQGIRYAGSLSELWEAWKAGRAVARDGSKVKP